MGLELQISHNWASVLGLMVEIIGATCYVSENPTLPPYVVSKQPLSSRSIPANPTTAQICTLTDKKNPKERLGHGEGFPQRRQLEHPRRAGFGVL